MPTITVDMVKRLRDQTNDTMFDCKTALIMHDGDFEAALLYLKETPYYMRRLAIPDDHRCPYCGR